MPREHLPGEFYDFDRGRPMREIGRWITRNQALERVRGGRDVYTPSNSDAVSLANDAVGYVPHETALDPQTGGGYETRLTSYSNLEPTAGRQITDALLDLASKLTPAPAPRAPGLPPFQGKPWTYGDRRPQLD